MKKLILKDFSLDEISSVDRPAQTPAKMTIIKRKQETKEPAVTKEEIEGLKKQLADVTAELEVTRKMSSLSDAEKGYMSNMTEKEKHSFAEMKPEERKAAMEMAKRADETLEMNGVVLFKSVVGQEQFDIMKNMQAQLNVQKAEIQKAKDIAEKAELVKKATLEFSHLPGTADEIADILKASSKMPESVQKSLNEMLVALEKMNASSFVTKGHKDGQEDNDDTPVVKLDKLAKARAKEESISYNQAYEKVLSENPALYESTIN